MNGKDLGAVDNSNRDGKSSLKAQNSKELGVLRKTEEIWSGSCNGVLGGHSPQAQGPVVLAL